MVINHNIAAMNSYRQLTLNTNSTNKSLAKLSSGLRINSAADDAAGLAISEKMKSQINGLDQASRNAQDGISLIQTAEGALNETDSILQRMRELSVQAASDTLQASDRTSISTEISQLNSEIDRISSTTQFNGQNLLDGSYGLKATTSTIMNNTSMVALDVAGAKAGATYKISAGTAGNMSLIDATGNVVVASVGAAGFSGVVNFGSLGIKISISNLSVATTNYDGATIVTAASGSAKFKIGASGASAANAAQEDLSLSIADMSSSALGTNNVKVDTHDNATAAIDSIDKAITTVNTQRSQLGAYQNRLEHTINNLGASEQNMTSAESSITDVDMAKEMMEYTRSNILTQAATSMLAQANQAPQSVLSLLK